MKKILKLLLIEVGLLPFIWLFITNLNSSVSNIGEYLYKVVMDFLGHPVALIGLIPIFISIIIPSTPDSSSKKTSESTNKDKKQKIIWRIILIIGILPFAIPLLYSIYCFFAGFEFFGTYKGLEGLYVALLVWSFLYWPTYIIGLFLIIITTIKLKKLKK